MSRPRPDERATWVAAVAQTAIATNASSTRAVAAHFGITRAAAKMAIHHARKLGYAIPYTSAAHRDRTDYGRGQPNNHAVLTCDCGHTVALTAWQPGPTMLRHTLEAHGRPARAHERTPREPQDVAA